MSAGYWQRQKPRICQAISGGHRTRKSKGRGGLLGNEVDKILNLRAKIAAASESSSSDSGSDWD